MDLRELRYFLAVAETGSFTQAAGRCFVTQPTLSAGIGRLEAELGARLFERGKQGARATEAGLRLLPEARAILARVETATSAVRHEDKPAFRLGLQSSLPARLIRPIRTALGPDIRILLREGDQADLVERLWAGRLHLALVQDGPGLSGLDARPIGRDAQVLAFPAGMAPDGPATPMTIHGGPLIVRTHCPFVAAARAILDDWGSQPRVVFRTRSDLRALEMVAEGIGPCLVPDSLAPPPGVVFRTVDGVRLERRLMAVSAPRPRLGHEMVRRVEHVLANIAAQPDPRFSGRTGLEQPQRETR